MRRPPGEHRAGDPAVSLGQLRGKLLAWYRAHRRDLPWRESQDPYSVWVSEIMLQQTRVDTVIPYYQRFLQRWPTVRALAAADPEEVKAAWSGLGYYRRARLMLEAAQKVIGEHRGEFPSSAAALKALPGFGRYTAGAVASIAFDLPEPAVDGNTSRVIARLLGIRGDVMARKAQDRIWSVAAELAKGEAPGELTQALMELGALICAPRSPRCVECPVSSHCIAERDGLAELIPPTRKRPAKTRLKLTEVLIRSGRFLVLLERRPAEGILAGLWTLPILQGHLEEAELASAFEERFGLRLSKVRGHGEIRHLLTHRELVIRLFEAKAVKRRLPALEWIDLRQLDRLGIPSITTRALAKTLPGEVIHEAQLPGRKNVGSRKRRTR